MGLRTIGTAQVPNPAGTDTGFHGGQFFLVAEQTSYEEETDMTEQEIKELQDQLAAALEAKTTLEASTLVLEEENTTLKAALEAKDAELSEAAAKFDLFKTRAPALVKAGVDVDGLPVDAWDDVTYDAFLTASTRQPGRQAAQPQPAVDDEQSAQAVTWATVFGG